jgi:hypothetical protein
MSDAGSALNLAAQFLGAPLEDRRETRPRLKFSSVTDRNQM